MRRQEALDVMKDIGASCKLLKPSAISFEHVGSAGHYEIHIKSTVDGENRQYLKAIAKKHSLGIKLTDKILIIYKPSNKKNGKLVQV